MAKGRKNKVQPVHQDRQLHACCLEAVCVGSGAASSLLHLDYRCVMFRIMQHVSCLGRFRLHHRCRPRSSGHERFMEPLIVSRCEFHVACNGSFFFRVKTGPSVAMMVQSRSEWGQRRRRQAGHPEQTRLVSHDLSHHCRRLTNGRWRLGRERLPAGSRSGMRQRLLLARTATVLVAWDNGRAAMALGHHTGPRLAAAEALSALSALIGSSCNLECNRGPPSTQTLSWTAGMPGRHRRHHA